MSSFLDEVMALMQKKTKNMKGGPNQATNSNVQVQGRKTHDQLNQDHEIILAFVKTKKDEHVASLDTIGGRDKFETHVTKWNKISIHVMNVHFSM